MTPVTCSGTQIAETYTFAIAIAIAINAAWGNAIKVVIPMPWRRNQDSSGRTNLLVTLKTTNGLASSI